MALDALDRLDDVEQATVQPVGAAPAPGGFSFSDSLDRLDNVETVFASNATAGPSQTIGPILVLYVPGANAAFTITPGTLDANNAFTPGAVTFGPYLAAVTLENGQYGLTAATSDPALPSPLAGAVSIQPGDYSGGVFSTLEIAAIVGSFAPETPTPPVPHLGQVVLSAGQPMNGIGGDNLITAGFPAVLSVLVTAADNVPGDAPVNITMISASLVVSQAGIDAGVSFPVTWNTATSGPYAGTWAQSVLSAADTAALNGLGACNVFVDFGGGAAVWADGLMLVQPNTPALKRRGLSLTR